MFKSCGGAGWKRKKGWMTDADLGEWRGVTVDAEGRVIRLRLNNNNLAGPLPSEIQQLSALQVLHLSSNQLTGPIPADIGQLEALAELHLGGNQLSGLLPAALGQLQALTHLHLISNQLSGPIPTTALAQMGALMFLNLSCNPLLSGQEAFRFHMQEHKPGCKLSC